MEGYLYTLRECGACEMARVILRRKGWGWSEVPIDNPLLEYGVQSIFSDRKVHAPVYVVPGEGVWIFLPQGDDMAVLAKVVSLRAADAGVLSAPEAVGVNDEGS